MKSVPTQEIRIYVGSREHYDGEPFGLERVLTAIRQYQKKAPEERRGCVRVSPTTYVFQGYREGGFEIGILSYPRFPLGDMFPFAQALANHLLESLRQNRISMVTAGQTFLLESEDAEDHPKTDRDAETWLGSRHEL